MIPISAADIIARFESLCARNVIFYSPPRVVRYEEGDFSLEFVISDIVAKKANFVTSIPRGDNADKRAQRGATITCFGPGSDIGFEDEDLLIAEILDSHLLVLNKFPILRAQLLLLTTDSYRRQNSPLEPDDMQATYSVLWSMGPSYYVLYNTCPPAGSSRDHKHMQVVPRTGSFFPDDKAYNRQKIPFLHFVHYIDKNTQSHEFETDRIYDAYVELLDSSRRALGIGKDEQCPHNVIMVQDYIVVVPRRTNNVEGLTANAASMMQYVWVGSDEQVEKWRTFGFRNALARFGLPNSIDDDVGSLP